MNSDQPELGPPSSATKDSEDSTRVEQITEMLETVLLGPLLIPIGISEGSVHLTAIGVGSALIYIAGIGLTMTYPPKEMISTLGFEQTVVAVQETAASVVQEPVFYLALAVVGGAIFATAVHTFEGFEGDDR